MMSFSAPRTTPSLHRMPITVLCICVGWLDGRGGGDVCVCVCEREREREREKERERERERERSCLCSGMRMLGDHIGKTIVVVSFTYPLLSTAF